MLPRSAWLAMVAGLVFAVMDNVMMLCSTFLFRLACDYLAAAFGSSLVLIVCALGSAWALAGRLLLVDTTGSSLTQQCHGLPMHLDRAGASHEWPTGPGSH